MIHEDDYDIMIYHERMERHPGTDVMAPKVKQKGGRTLALIMDKEGKPLAGGEAICNPSDNYNKKLGRIIATGRAKKALTEGDPLPGWVADRLT